MRNFSPSHLASPREKLAGFGVGITLAVGAAACAPQESPQPTPTHSTYETPDTNQTPRQGGLPTCASGIPTPLNINIRQGMPGMHASYAEKCTVPVHDPNDPDKKQPPLSPNVEFKIICINGEDELRVQRATDPEPLVAKTTIASVGVLRVISSNVDAQYAIRDCNPSLLPATTHI